MISLLHISCYCQPRLPRTTPLSSLPLRNIWSKLQASGRCGWWSVWHWRDNYLEYKPKTWKIRKFSFKCQDQVGGLNSIIGLLSWLKTFFFTPTLGLRTTAVITISSNSPSHSLSLKSNICKSFFGRPLNISGVFPDRLDLDAGDGQPGQSKGDPTEQGESWHHILTKLELANCTSCTYSYTKIMYFVKYY